MPVRTTNRIAAFSPADLAPICPTRQGALQATGYCATRVAVHRNPSTAANQVVQATYCNSASHLLQRDSNRVASRRHIVRTHLLKTLGESKLGRTNWPTTVGTDDSTQPNFDSLKPKSKTSPARGQTLSSEV